MSASRGRLAKHVVCSTGIAEPLFGFWFLGVGGVGGVARPDSRHIRGAKADSVRGCRIKPGNGLA